MADTGVTVADIGLLGLVRAIPSGTVLSLEIPQHSRHASVSALQRVQEAMAATKVLLARGNGPAR